MSKPVTSLDERVVLSIFRASSLLAKAGNRLAGSLGLSQQQWVVLAAIARGGPEGLPLSALGRNLLVTKANITGMVDRLERDGYVAREAHPTDRRITRARLTPKGRRFLAQVAPLQRAWSGRAFGGFSGAEKTTLLGLIDRCIQCVPEADSPKGGRTWRVSRPS